MDVNKKKTAFQNKKITTTTFAHTNNVHLHAQSHVICVKEILMSTDAKKKMYALSRILAIQESFVQAPAQLTVKTAKLFAQDKLITLIPSTEVA
jgi:hypothetical protein